jgi:hypothetical protein
VTCFEVLIQNFSGSPGLSSLGRESNLGHAGYEMQKKLTVNCGGRLIYSGGIGNTWRAHADCE